MSEPTAPATTDQDGAPAVVNLPVPPGGERIEADAVAAASEAERSTPPTTGQDAPVLDPVATAAPTPEPTPLPDEVQSAIRDVAASHSSTNGTGKKPPQVRRREAWIELPGDYEGFRYRAWVNHPHSLIMQAKYAANDALQTLAFCQIVLEHNGWRNEDGDEYPPANTPEFWEQIPDELAGAVILGVEQEKEKLPNLMRQLNRR